MQTKILRSISKKQKSDIWTSDQAKKGGKDRKPQSERRLEKVVSRYNGVTDPRLLTIKNYKVE